MPDLIIIGGGLAGCEAAWQAANRDIQVRLYEMRPHRATGAHVSADLAELVCSNSLGSQLRDRPSGLLIQEIKRLGSLLIECAAATALPAGGALAVDRQAFAHMVSRQIEAHPNIEVIRQEYPETPNQPAIIASGPLTSNTLSRSIQQLTQADNLFFYDAIAPIVSYSSIDQQIAFRASRYGRGQQEAGDYINCPLSKEEYHAFVQELQNGTRIELKEFENEIQQGVRAGRRAFFEGCLPIEVIAARGSDALAYGPLRPVGLINPHTGVRPHAVVQLRQDNLAGDLYNLVGFQTNLTYPEQKRIFRMIPGLEKAEFIRYGQMHRNTFIASPRLLEPSLRFRQREDLFFAGQITGVEGYLGNIATGLLAGINAARCLNGQPLLVLPTTTMLGALCHYITHADDSDFQPMKANFGILPPLEVKARGKRERAALYVERSLHDLDAFFVSHSISGR